SFCRTSPGNFWTAGFCAAAPGAGFPSVVGAIPGTGTPAAPGVGATGTAGFAPIPAAVGAPCTPAAGEATCGLTAGIATPGLTGTGAPGRAGGVFPFSSERGMLTVSPEGDVSTSWVASIDFTV